LWLVIFSPYSFEEEFKSLKGQSHREYFEFFDGGETDEGLLTELGNWTDEVS
jgi:hypothetical protein